MLVFVCVLVRGVISANTFGDQGRWGIHSNHSNHSNQDQFDMGACVDLSFTGLHVHVHVHVHLSI